MLGEEEIERLVNERAQLRRLRQFDSADEIKAKLESFGVMLSDIPYRQGGGSTWIKKLDPIEDLSLLQLSKEVYELNDPSSQRVQDIILQTKEYLLALERRREIASQWKLIETNLLGRKYADIAFKFSMGGVSDSELYRLLGEGHLSEIQRFGHRRSCGVMDLAQMAEKLACAGYDDQRIFQVTGRLIRSKILEAELSGQSVVCSSLESLESGEYNVLSSHPLRMLWRFAAKQSKHGKQRKDEQEQREDPLMDDEAGLGDGDLDEELSGEQETPRLIHASPNPLPSLETIFDDLQRPLVLDLGCGFGTSLLGLCLCLERQSRVPRSNENESPPKRARLEQAILPQVADMTFVSAHSALQDLIREKGCNFLGCDMSKRAVGYATGLSSRWKIQNRCQFLHCDVESLLQLVLSSDYPGPIIWVNINFPTPYSQRLLPRVAEMQSFVQKKRRESTSHLPSPPPADHSGSRNGVGNSQLPESLNDFMVSPNLIKTCALLFERPTTRPLVGFLYLQSNAEDVALTMRSFVDSLSLHCDEVPNSFPELKLIGSELTGRFTCVGTDESLITSTMVSTLWNSDYPQGDGSVWVTPDAVIARDSKRQEMWAELVAGSHPEGDSTASLRAVGKGWWKESPLPDRAQTETEAVCSYRGKPIHRILFAYTN
jgi:SAM-dependent methyltransferase